MHVLFDSECAMCDAFVIFIDKFCGPGSNNIIITGNPMKFTEIVEPIMSQTEIFLLQKKTIIVAEDRILYYKSQAISKILSATKSKRMKLIAISINLCPSFISEVGYDLISKFRRKLGKKSTKCSKHSFKYLEFKE